MKHMAKCLAVVAAVFAMSSAAMAEEEEGAVGWTPVAIGLASPVQLPWGMARWDVFGVDLGLLYTDAPKMYGLDLALGGCTTRDDAGGLIVGGLFNYSSEDKDVYGLRATLGANISRGTVYGVEAGTFAYRHDIWGLDFELAGNFQDNVTGGQFSGLANITTEQSYGLTFAFGGNIATKKAYGCQAAVVFNMAEELHGAQIAFVNYARECPWGFQIGLINIIMDNKIKVLPIVNGYF